MNLILWGIAFLGIYVHQSVSQSVQCYSAFSLSTGECGNLLGQVEKYNCCLNTNYGYVEADGVCRYCGRATWTEWSSWGECSKSCTDGVKQRRRACHGIGKCSDPEELGSLQTQMCEKTCCPVEGGWSEWGNWQPCSVTCDNGQRKRQRTCSKPVPQCGGSCIGNDEEIDSCATGINCPIHGGWSSWGSWGPCPVTCTPEGQNPQKELRKRMCNSPTPSKDPPGRGCDGSDTDTRPCSGIPFCPIDGNWGAWSDLTSCSVTCGVGQQTQSRLCNSPEPKHGGRMCQGEEQISKLCTIHVNCPINGIWTEWSTWSLCKPRSNRKIKCRNSEGDRRKERSCVGREHGGNFCVGEIVKHESCYEIDGCEMNGILLDWSNWSFCKPSCGPNSTRSRERKCIPDLVKYKSKDLSMFVGKPKLNCTDSVKGEHGTWEPCTNVPEC